MMSLLIPNPGVAPVRRPAAKSGRLISFTLLPKPGETAREICHRLAEQLAKSGAVPLHLLVFGKCNASGAVTDSLRKVFGSIDWPITWVEGTGCGKHPLAGLQVHACTGAVERVQSQGGLLASVFTNGGARQCFAGGIMPANLQLSNADQTRCALYDLKMVLAEAGFELADIVRTWFYLDDILSWYNDFNQARTAIYAGLKFNTGSMPASTGIGARNPTGAALALAAWAFRPMQTNSYAEEVASPLQCPAPAYGSSFSRAMEISTNHGRQLFISGTASIAPGGKTEWVGNARQQVNLTMEVVEAILRSRGFAFKGLSRATAYFRHASDAGIFSEWLAARQLSNLPVVSTQCDVCRDDLLFELEGEALSAD